MNYSLTFGGDKNTWDDWHLIPNSPPMVSPPEPVTNLVDIPGRMRGPLDLTTYPFNRTCFKRITGTWMFLRDTTYKEMRVDMYQVIREYLHGRTMTVKMEEDPMHYFQGRFIVSAPANSVGPTSINIGYDLEPCRYNLNGTVDTTWVTDATYPAWAPNTQYLVDDKVVYDGVIYVCISAHTSGNSFDSSKWQSEALPNRAKGRYY